MKFLNKYILDEVRLKVKKEDKEEFISLMKETKSILILHNLLPDTYELFGDIDNEKEVYSLVMGFESDSHFDEWEAKYKKLEKEFSELNKKIFKFVTGYNYSEKIEL